MIAYSKSNRNRTAVYSGKKTSVFYSPDEPFPTLKDMCILILQENVDRIDECGNLDYKVMKPVLERAKPDDLMRIEEYNPKLMDDTGTLILENICSYEMIFSLLLAMRFAWM